MVASFLEKKGTALSLDHHWPTAIITWMISPAGAAMAGWASGATGIIAAVVAVRAYLNDKRRAQEDRLREQRRLDMALGSYLIQVMTLADEALDSLEALQNAAEEKVAASATVFAGSSRFVSPIQPIIDALERIGHGPAPSAVIGLFLSRLINALRRAAAINSSYQMQPKDIAEAAESLKRDVRRYRVILEAQAPASG
jgi:hypothetical protein